MPAPMPTPAGTMRRRGDDGSAAADTRGDAAPFGPGGGASRPSGAGPGSIGAGGVPPVAAWIGAAGLLPFYGLALGVWVAGTPQWAGFLLYAQLLWAAIVASFAGAAHWGFAAAALDAPGPANVPGPTAGGPDPRRDEAVRHLLYGAVPALAGWAVLLAFQLTLGAPVSLAWLAALLMALVLGGAWLADRRAVRVGLAPEWYRDLRGPLTLAAVVALAGAAAATA